MKLVQPIRDANVVDQFKEFAKQESIKTWMIFEFGLATALRISDILPVTVGQVRNKMHFNIFEEKTGKHKMVRIPDDLIPKISEYTYCMKDSDYLFPSQKGGHIKRGHAWRILKEIALQLGIPDFGCHTMRKTAGFFHYKQYKDVALLQNIFNHSSPAITLRYIGITQELMDESMNGLRIAN